MSSKTLLQRGQHKLKAASYKKVQETTSLLSMLPREAIWYTSFSSVKSLRTSTITTKYTGISTNLRAFPRRFKSSPSAATDFMLTVYLKCRLTWVVRDCHTNCTCNDIKGRVNCKTEEQCHNTQLCYCKQSFVSAIPWLLALQVVRLQSSYWIFMKLTEYFPRCLWPSVELFPVEFTQGSVKFRIGSELQEIRGVKQRCK